MRPAEQGGLEPTSVSSFNALFEVLQFPLLFEKGVGGYFYAKGGDAVVSTTGARLTLSDYSRAMVYQNPRLHHMGRLAQEYALVQHSRHVNYLLMYQRNGMLQGNLRRRRDKKAGVAGDGTRVSMSASVVGSQLCVHSDARLRAPPCLPPLFSHLHFPALPHPARALCPRHPQVPAGARGRFVRRVAARGQAHALHHHDLQPQLARDHRGA